ncbi:hypothetical protein ABT173_42285 [Streptomyces sp. NPDC001795]|uniref:hypothetical protein n=1 Tax=Streptomyces sp. NPDC001795 TaxID=3154525 RepID=UPI003326A814
MSEPNGSAPSTAQVYFDSETTEEQRTALYEGLAGLGVHAEGGVVGTFRTDPLTWLILVVLPLNGFLEGCGKEFAQDAYRTAKRVIGGALVRRRGGDANSETTPASEAGRDAPVLMLEDTATSTRFTFEPGLPDDAYRQLFDLDLSSCEGRTLRFAAARNRWE